MLEKQGKGKPALPNFPLPLLRTDTPHSVRRFEHWKLLSNAKPAEYDAQQIIRREFARDAVERFLRQS